MENRAPSLVNSCLNDSSQLNEDVEQHIPQWQSDLLMLGFSQSLLDLAASKGVISRVIGLLKYGSTTVLEKATHVLYMPTDLLNILVCASLALLRHTRLLNIV